MKKYFHYANMLEFQFTDKPWRDKPWRINIPSRNSCIKRKDEEGILLSCKLFSKNWKYLCLWTLQFSYFAHIWAAPFSSKLFFIYLWIRTDFEFILFYLRENSSSYDAIVHLIMMQLDISNVRKMNSLLGKCQNFPSETQMHYKWKTKFSYHSLKASIHPRKLRERFFKTKFTIFLVSL